MAAHHKACDEMFSDAEAAFAKAEWDKGSVLWGLFSTELEKHFSREEDLLFPRFEAATGMMGGPTQMMRMEHEQMRALLQDLDAAINNKDQDEFLALSETLMMTMQQHNLKEEQILYPMIDQALPEAVEMIEAMSQD